MGAIHDASGGYYGTTLTGQWTQGHPGNKVGFAVGAGIRINFPMIGPGDFFQMQVNYAQGALKYVGNTQPGSNSMFRFNGNEMAVGFLADGYYCGNPNVDGQTNQTNFGCPSQFGSGSNVELTTAWGINAAYEHFWTPSLRTSVWGSYMQVSHNSNAKAMVAAANGCNDGVGGAGQYTVPGVTPSPGNTIRPAPGTLYALTNCDPNWSWWAIGSRTQWNVTKDFYMGVDVYYTKLNTAFEGYGNYRAFTNTAPPGGSGSTAPSGQPAYRYVITDQDNVGTRIRFHRDINP
jgi:hypothetical protein